MDIRKFIYRGPKRVAYVMGIDRPFVRSSSKPGFKMNDHNLFCYGRNPDNLSVDGYDFVNFYWDPNCTALIRKQYHKINNFIKNLTDKTVYDQNIRAIIAALIYKLKHTINYVSPKSPSRFVSLRDSYLHDRPSEIRTFHKRTLARLADIGFRTDLIYTRTYEIE
jgi:hypothetical protein